jgi:hypothetical protein
MKMKSFARALVPVLSAAVILFATAAPPAAAQGLKDIKPGEPLTLKARGSFFVGGEKVEQTAIPPDLGIRGNTHMIMQDKNSLQIADLILQWIEKNVSKGGRN